MKHKTFFTAEQQLKRKLKTAQYNAVERHALIAIIDNNDGEFTRLLNIMKKRKRYNGYLRVVK